MEKVIKAWSFSFDSLNLSVPLHVKKTNQLHMWYFLRAKSSLPGGKTNTKTKNPSKLQIPQPPGIKSLQMSFICNSPNKDLLMNDCQH